MAFRDYVTYCNKVPVIEGHARVERGGSWNNSAENCTVSYRNNNSPDNRNNNIGFRVALSQFKDTEDICFLTIDRSLSLRLRANTKTICQGRYLFQQVWGRSLHILKNSRSNKNTFKERTYGRI